MSESLAYQEHHAPVRWPSLFPTATDSMPGPGPDEDLSSLTRVKLERALSTRKSLRHIVLLTNAFASSNLSSNASSPTASFYSEVIMTGHSQCRHETPEDETRRKEQEWFDALLDGFIQDEDVEGEEGYVDVSFRDTAREPEHLEEASPDLTDSGWMENKDFSAHTAYQIPLAPTESLSEPQLSSSPSDSLPDLTLDNNTPDSSPELSSLSVRDLQLIPYCAAPLYPPKPPRQSVDICSTHRTPLHSSDTQLKSLRLSINVVLPIGWDLQDFGPLPADRGERRVLDDIYVNHHPRRSRSLKKNSKASILVQSLLLS